MASTAKLIPIYTSKGDVGGFLVYPYLFNSQGEWIGWVTEDRKVYSVRGNFVGKITSEPRILREREFRNEIRRENPPPAPRSIQPPLRVPLAPLMAEVSQNLIDVLEEAPDLLPPMGFDMMQEDAG